MADISTQDSDVVEVRHDRMQRVRVGLTGLAVVLLVVALATMLYRNVGDNGSSSVDTVSAAGKDEPLADLGVAPGAPSNESANSLAAKPNR